MDTSSPVIIYQMVDENLQVSELVYKVLLLGIEQASYFRERSSLSLFTR